MTPFHLLPEVLSDVDFAPAKAVEPSKRWRNWYLSRAPWRFQRLAVGDVITPGDKYPGVKVVPSRDVAETIASKYLASTFRCGDLIGAHIIYLGAFPEGEQP